MMPFTFNFTEDKLIKCLPRNKKCKDLYPILSELLRKYNISSLERVAAFLAQCGHESADFTILQENLNYSAAGLRATFSKYFTDDKIALEYQRKPEKIANRVYSNRMGNSDEASGDGYKFRGRGAIQLTGKTNYSAFGKYINIANPSEVAAYCETLKGAIESACWFWSINMNLNQWADKKDMITLTKKINGGTNGLKERIDHFNKNLLILQ